MTLLEAAKEMRHLLDIQDRAKLFFPNGQLHESESYKRASAAIDKAIECHKAPNSPLVMLLSSMTIGNIETSNSAEAPLNLIDLFKDVGIVIDKVCFKIIEQQPASSENRALFKLSITAHCER